MLRYDYTCINYYSMMKSHQILAYNWPLIVNTSGFKLLTFFQMIKKVYMQDVFWHIPLNDL